MAFGKYKFKNELHPVEVKSMGFKEFKRDETAVRKALANAEKEAFNESEQGLPLFKLNKGQTVLRVLPPYDEQGLWLRELKRHDVYYEDVRFAGTCPGWSECPLCQARKEIKGNDEASLELSKQLRYRKIYIFNVLVYQEPGGVNLSNGVQVLMVGVRAGKQLIKADVDTNVGLGDITNIQVGHDIYIDRTGDGLQTEYSCRAHAQKTDLRATLSGVGVDLDSFTPFPLDKIMLPPPREQLEAVVECLGLTDSPKSGVETNVATRPTPAPTPVGPVVPGVVPQTTTTDPNPDTVPVTPTAPVGPVVNPVPGPTPPFNKGEE